MTETARGRGLVRMAQGLFMLNSVIWIGIGVATVVRMAGEGPEQTIAIWVMGILMLANAGAMALSAAGLGRGGRLFFSTPEVWREGGGIAPSP
jgi:hypothetical protein